MRNNLKTSLEKLLKPIKEKLRMHPSERELKNIQKELTNVVIDVSETFRLYAEELDQHYEKNKPFSNENETEDIEDFMQLIQYSFITGSYTILKNWAIDYPLNNPEVLKGSLEEYVIELRADLEEDWDDIVCEEGWHPEAKVYWQYLVDTLSANLPIHTSAGSGKN